MPKHKNSGSFKKGQKAWNKQDLYINCLICGKKVKTIKVRLKHKFCSKECQYKYKRNDTKRFKIVSLYKEGKRYREIADIMGMKIGSVCHYLYTEKIKDRWGNDSRGFSYKIAIKRKLGIKSCELCGYERAIEVSHIIEASNGGKYKTDNCLIFCPNCHTLFDKGLLSKEEINKLFLIKRIKNNLKKRYESKC